MIQYNKFFFLFVMFIISCTSKNMETQVINVFNKYEQLNKEFVKNPNTRKKLEDYMYNEYAKSLNIAKKKICNQTNENLIAKKFIKLYIKTNKNSSNEIPMFTLGDMYICKPDFIIQEISSLKTKNKRYMTEELYLGFLNITYNKTLKNHEDLINKLKKLEYYNEVSNKINNLMNNMKLD